MGALATSAVYAAAAALLLGACHRLVRPLSARAGLALALLPLCFTGRAMLTGQVYAPIDLPFQAEPWHSVKQDYGVGKLHNPTLSDLYCQIIPWRKAVRWAFSQGEWPLWNPFILGGDILAAAAQPAPYYPPNLASLLLPLDLSLTFLAAVTFLAAAAGAFLFLRELACREEAALLGAAGWSFSSFLAFWQGWPLGATAALFPWVLLGAGRIAAAPGRRSTGLLTAVLLALLLAGHPESALHAVAAAAAFGIFQLVTLAPLAGRRRPDLRRAARALAAALAAGAFALLLAAFFLLPILEALPQSREHHHRLAILARLDRSVPAVEAWQRAKVNFVPFVYGVSQGRLVPSSRFPHLVPQSAAYAGSLLFAPALYALWASRRPERWFLLGLFVTGAAAGASAPGVSDLLGRLPLFAITINERLVFVAALAVAALAALGAEAWAERGGRGLGLVAALVTAGLALWTARLWPEMREWGLPPAFLGPRTLLLLAPPALAALLLLGAGRTGTRRTRLGLAALLALLLLQRTAEDGDLYPTLPRRVFYPLVEPLDILPRAEEPYRVVARSYTLIPNTSALYELEDVRGYEAMTNRRLAETFPLWSEPQAGWFNRVDDLSRPFLSFLNVRYAVDPYGTPPPRGWRRRVRGPGTRLLVNRRVLPRAFVPEEIRVGLPAGEILAEMAETAETAGAAGFAGRSWVSGTGWDRLPRPRTLANGPGTAVARRQGSGYRLEAEMAAPGWIVVSETAWKGWRAFIAEEDRGRRARRARWREIPVAFGNHAFLALHLPAGRHEVRLSYWPRSFTWGLAASGGTLLVLCTWAFVRRPRGSATT